MDSPTIVVARLDDKELQESIKSMVTSFNKGLDDMKKHTDSVVSAINESLKGIKGGSESSGGTSDGGSTKRAKAYSEEGKQIEQNVERQKEYNATLDQTAAIIQKAASGKKKGIEYASSQSGVDKDLTYLIDINDKVGRQLGDAMQKEQALLDAKNREVTISQEAAQAQQQVTNAVSGTAIAYRDIHIMAEQALGIKHNADGSKQKQASDVQYLREQLASLLEVEQREVTLTNTKQASYNELSAELKQLTAAYNRLGADRVKTEGEDIVQRIQSIQREMQKLQKTMSRPISLKEALSGSEKTLDDIAYKMQRLQMYKSGLDLKTQGYEIGEVNRKYDELRRTQLKYMSDSQKMSGINEALGRSWNYMKNRLAFYFTVGASTQLVKELIRVRSEYEMNERALGVLISSAERGSQIFRELSQMALVSPYTLIELSGAAKQLTAYDVAAKDVVDTTRRLADMASAVGVPIERLTYALGQIKAYGYLNSRDNRMFLNAGIPLVRQLADYYSDLEGKMVSTADVYDRIKQKAVDYNDVMQVLNRMTDEGGRFFDFQGKMAETLKVQLANLTLAWNNMLNDIGQQTQGFAVNAFKVLRQLFVHWKDIDAAILAVFKTLAVGAAGGAVYKFLDFLRQLKTGAVTAQAAIGGLQTSLIRFSKSAAWANIKGGGWFLLLSALSNAVWEVAFNFDSATEEMSKAVRESAENTYKDISEFLDGKELRRIIKSLRDGTAEGQNEDNLSKAWEKVREEILLVSMAGEGYVQTLQEIEDVGERLQKGFGILEDVQTVAAVLKDMGDYGIWVDKDWSQFWNLWTLPDGLFENLRDYGKELDDVIEKYGSLEALRSQVYGQNGQRLYGTDAAKDYDNLATAQQRFNENLQTTITSIHKIISLNEGWSSDVGKINELYAQVAHNLALQGSLSPEETFKLQLAMEKERAKDAKEAIKIRLADETAAINRALDEQSKMRIRSNIETLRAELQDFDKYNGESKVYWNDFTKYIKERRISEAREMFKGLSAEEIQHLDFSKGKYKDWVDDMVRGYAKSHKMSYDEAFQYLHNWVRSANKWSIFIPLTISTEDSKTEMQILEEADAAYQQAEKEIERLTTRKKELEALGASSVGTSKIDKEYAKTLKEITQAEKDLEDARAKGGHGKEKKSGKGGSKKDPVLDALKTEIKLVEQLQGEYDKLTKSGANREEALGAIRGAFGNTIKQLNSQLRGYGLPELTTQLITGKDPNKALAHFKQTLQSLVDKGMKSLERSKEVEAIIEKLTISAKTYNLDKITKGLNSELDKLKEEYELAVALDTDPELGNVFASYFGIDTEKLPHDFEQVAKLAQERIGKVLQENHYEGTAIDVESLLDKKKFDQWVKDSGQELESNLVKALEAIRAFLHKTQVDEIKSQEESWKKLLEKYAEYEYKIKKIHEKAEEERKVARAKNAGQDIIDAINKRERQELARAHFEKFKESYEWIAATGDLAGYTDKALRGLIKTLIEYKKNAKNLDPKQIKQINNALKSLYRAQREGNPFAYLLNLFDEASDRLEDLPQEVKDAMQEIQRIRDKARDDDRELTRAEKDRIKELKKITSPYDAFTKINAKEVVKGINSIISTINEATSVLGDFFGAMSGDKYRNAMKDIQDLIGVFEKAGKAAETGAKIGGAWGAAIGAVIGFATGLIQMFNQLDQEIVNKAIEGSQAKAQKYQNQIDRLKLSVDELSDAQERLNRVMGYGLSMDMKDNYKQQLLLLKAQKRETERQIELEKSRLGKYYDEKAIADLEGQLVSLDGTIAELERSIKNTVSEITDDLLGISRGSWADELTKSLIDSFRQGEKYMDVFEKSWDDMINNMIATVVSEKVVGFAMEKYLLKPLDSAIDEIESGAHAEKARLEELKKRVEQGILTPQNMNEAPFWDKEIEQAMKALGIWEEFQKTTMVSTTAHGGTMGRTMNGNARDGGQQTRDEFFAKYGETIKNYILGGIDSLIDDAALQESTAWITAVKDIVTNTDIKDKVKDSVGLLDDILADFGVKFGDQKKSELSALSQGISSISEETANSIEAYLNGVSQQVYLHSTLLTQIRDVMVTFDPEVSMGIQSQMLLQLQTQYQLMESMHSLMSSWTNPAGNGIRVEML